MRVGISISSCLSGPDPQTALQWMVERARCAHAAGLDSLSLGDNHATATPYMQNTPTLGRLMAEWPDRPVGCLFLLPLWNPVLVAEQIGTLAAMTNAPFIVQTGIGSSARQFEIMGSDLHKRGRNLDIAVRRIKDLLAGPAADGAQINPRPMQDVEWWIGAGFAPVALRRAARIGNAWYAGPGLTNQTARAPLATYVEACQEIGAAPRAIVRKDIVLSADGTSAIRMAGELVSAGYRGLGLDQVLAGSPAQVADALRSFADLGFSEVTVRCMSVPQRAALTSIELMAEVRDLLSS